MANRAYLYAAEQVEIWERPEKGYYDSRWCIPLAWFFFYSPQDIRRMESHDHSSSWQEVKCAVDKAAALARFAARQRLLVSIVIGARLSPHIIADFVETIGRRPGRYLLLDPAEVLGDMVEDETWHAERFTHLLTLLDRDAVRPEAVVEAAYPYVEFSSASPDTWDGQVVGDTYA